MFPAFCLTRLNYRINSMTCNNPCSNCNCEETVYDSSYQELDSSPMATQQASYFERLEAAADIILKDMLATERA
jgi:hypothetical protein